MNSLWQKDFVTLFTILAYIPISSVAFIRFKTYTIRNMEKKLETSNQANLYMVARIFSHQANGFEYIMKGRIR